ncbi:unnamed protein product, partial [Tuber aestivum]
TQFVRNIRYSILPVLGIDGSLHVRLLKVCSFTCQSYEKFILQEVLPHMNCIPNADSVLVMDNTRIHKSQLVVKLATAAGIAVEFLPPYSPDTNPIEEAFSVYKAWLRR